MKETLDTILKIKATNSTKDKIAILFSKKEDKLLKCILNLVYNPTISTKIAKKKLEKSLEPIENTLNVYDFLYFLENKSTGKDSDIQIAQSFMNQFENEHRELWFDIITQSLSIGMDVKNINKGYGHTFIQEVAPMLASNWEKMNDKDKECEYAVTTKLDGCRVMIFVYNDGEKSAYSRNGLRLEGFEDFLSKLNLPRGYVYDGELLPSNTKGLESKEQYKAIMKITRTKGDKCAEEIIYNIFDMIPLSDYDKLESPTYKERRNLIDDYITDTQYQRVVPVVRVINFNKDYEWLRHKLDEVVDNGEEGLMVNKLNSKYTYKRGRDIFKLKKFNTVDLKVLRLEEGEGKYKGTLGKIICNYKGYELGVGSGFTDDERYMYWNNPELIQNKIVEISYFEETSNDNQGLSLRFPVYKGLRTDKFDESYD